MKIKKLFSRRVTSLLLVFLLALSVLPTGALAAEVTDEEAHVHTSSCTIGSTEAVTNAETDLMEQSKLSAENKNIFIQTISDNCLAWDLDEATGILTISGTGIVPAIHSPDEQPWASIRERISYVQIDLGAKYFVADIAYWFSGCTNLLYAEVPGNWLIIGDDAFEGCVNLQELLILTHETPVISETAFCAENASDLWVMVNSDESYNYVLTSNWHGRNITVENYANAATYDGSCGINGCACTSCTYTYAYEYRDEDYHWKWAVCSDCTASEYAYGGRNLHVYNASGYCSYCGAEESASCAHSSTYYSWSGCTYYEYCSSCDEYLGSGTSHGTYSYGAWEYYNSSSHRRYASCNDCGEGSYSYVNHATTTKYTEYSETQHKYGKYCPTCSSYVGSISYENHRFSYSSWTKYSSTQHHRDASCTCGYCSEDYEDHADHNSDGYCDTCSYLMTFFSVTVPANMSLAVANDGYVYSATNAAVVNNSSHAVEITSVMVTAGDGWTIVPYDYSMADEKVDAKLIGFYLNDAMTTQIGTREKLTLPTNWTIDRGDSFSLEYDAIVSATSDVLTNEQVLTLMFVINWVPR